jgi:MYXO-CTERM domain-containing protein
MNLRRALAASFVVLSSLVAVVGAEAPAWAGTACSTDPTQCLCIMHPDDCSAAVQNNGAVVNDIFRDSNGNDGLHLPVYGKIINNFPNCGDTIDNDTCAGVSNPTPTPAYNCPSNYTCATADGTVQTAATYLNALDHQWWQPCRLTDPTLYPLTVGANTYMCPNFNQLNCIADQQGGNYLPWDGLVFDLGGPSNKVVIFAENDHGPQPCESLEYTVFLSDNPFANQMTDIILDPAKDGVDPMKWNRAVLSKIYTWGWFNTRSPDPTNFGVSCGDTTDYAVEDDSFVQVFSLPCGITFRYTAVVAGNDGRDFPECTYHSSEAEVDAVAGLTENGAAVCPDDDHDGYVDCNCAGAPAPPGCDCNDADPNIHPGAPEACDAAADDNCDGTIGTACPGTTVCYQSVCDVTCGSGEAVICPPGAACTDTPEGRLCVPTECGCAPGQICVNNACVDACQGVVCPGTQVCEGGTCVDPCAHLQCPAGQMCEAGLCAPPCNCFAGNVGCPNAGSVCDTGNSNQCVPTACAGVTCPAGQTCDPPSGTCVSFCNGNVACPSGQKCIDPDGCVPLCTDVTCQGVLTCDPKTGTCVDMTCATVTCISPQVCVDGACVMSDAGAPDGGASSGTGGGTSASGSTGTHSSGAGGEGGAGSSGPGAPGKCGCRTVGDGEERLPAGGAALALLGLLATRRRRKG